MKIAHIISHNDHNGVTSSGSALIREMVARGHELMLIHRPDAWIGKQSFPDTVRLIPMEMGKRILNYGECRRVRALLDEWGVDVIHTHGTGADRIGALWYWRWDRPVVAKAPARIPHFHWRFHDAVVAPSAYTRDWFVKRKLVSPDRLFVNPNFVQSGSIISANEGSRQRLRAELGLGDDAFVVGIVGSVNGRKNQSSAVPILHGLAGLGIDAHLAVIGGGTGDEYNKLNARARELSMTARVHTMGQREDVMELTAGFDAALCVSRDEQGPIVVIEALAAGVPCVSTAVGMVPTLIKSGISGYILDPARIGGAIAYLEQIAKDPAFAQEQAAQGRRVFEASLKPDPILNRFEQIYGYVIDHRQGRRAQRPSILP